MNILPREELIPLTPQVAAVLLALASGPRHGYVIAQFCASESGGLIDVSVGSLYHVLTRLVKKGLIEPAGTADATSSPYKRKLFRLTPRGRKVLEWEADRQSEFVSLARLRLTKPERR